MSAGAVGEKLAGPSGEHPRALLAGFNAQSQRVPRRLTGGQDRATCKD